jgi:hypothetical protein
MLSNVIVREQRELATVAENCLQIVMNILEEYVFQEDLRR